MTRAYKVVDVFTRQPLYGNPVAVVLDSHGLDTQAMQRIAQWTNLFETTFVLPPTQAGADYRLRIFSPRGELPFAGHPTLGTAYAVLEAGLASSRNGILVQECKVGLIELRLEHAGSGSRLTLNIPPAVVTPLTERDADNLEEVIRSKLDRTVAPALVNVGVAWVVAQLPSVDALLSLKPDYSNSAELERRLGATGVCLYAMYPSGNEAAIEVRSFLPSCGVEEDPVCGSGNAGIGAFRFARGLLPRDGASYVASQGRCVGREGRVFVSVSSEGRVGIGGECMTCVSGELRF